MAGYELLVDGEKRGRVASDDEARAWLRGYREEHAEDDPDAVARPGPAGSRRSPG